MEVAPPKPVKVYHKIEVAPSKSYYQQCEPWLLAKETCNLSSTYENLSKTHFSIEYVGEKPSH
jgi:hypothetical protein